MGVTVRPISGRNDCKEFGELRHSQCLAPRLEHVIIQIVLVVRPQVDGRRISFTEVQPHSTVFVRINEGVGLINGAVRVTDEPNIPLRSTTITDDSSAGSIQARITFTSVSAIRSGTATRKVLSDSRSTPPNTHCPLTGCPRWYLRRPNLVSSISTVLDYRYSQSSPLSKPT
jgi:hypothetical protein